MELRPAGDVVDAALASWEARTNAVLAPMSASIDTALKIITHALKLASDQGYCEIKIRSTPLTGQARQDNHTFQQTKQLPAVLSMMARVDFVVDLGFAWVPVGASLTREDAKGFWIHHRAISGHPAEMDMDAFVALCDGFDGEVMHSWTLAGEALESDLGRMFLRWRLRRAGYVSRAHHPRDDALPPSPAQPRARPPARATPGRSRRRQAVSADGKKPTSLIEFRTTEFKRTHPEPGEPWLVVACGAAGRRLAGQLRGAEETFEEIEGPAGEERGTTGASFAAYVEATAESASNFNCDAFPTTFGATLAVMPEVIRAAGRINANALCARKKRSERSASPQRRRRRARSRDERRMYPSSTLRGTRAFPSPRRRERLRVRPRLLRPPSLRVFLLRPLLRDGGPRVLRPHLSASSCFALSSATAARVAASSERN